MSRFTSFSCHNTLCIFQSCPSQSTKQSTCLLSISLSPRNPFQTNTSTHKTTKALLSNIVSPPLNPCLDPNRFFTGNFAPVTELAPTDCTVIEGQLPTYLNGIYIRNGPNPQYITRGPLHPFEADGMVHCLTLSDGHATFCSRYVKTYKYMMEREAGFPIFPNMFTGVHGFADIGRLLMNTWRILSGQIDLMRGFGLANTSVAFFSNKLVALGESDLPYVVNMTKEDDVETVGRWDFDNRLFANMTAHPKIDMDTHELFSFRCTPFFPYLTYFYFDENGVKQNEVPILSLRESCLIHDFAITKRFAIFPENQFSIDPTNLILGKGMPVIRKPTKVPRIGIIPRYATDEADIKWFSIPGFNPVHVINAWEIGEDEIVLVAPNIKNLECMLHSLENISTSLEKVTINIRTGKVSRSGFCARKNLEMGSINAFNVGKKTRYAYMGVIESVMKMSGVVKVDLENECEVSTRFYGPNCFGGEPLFVPRSEEDLTADEDDGYVVTYVHNELSGESKFLVMNAKSPKLDIIAAVRLPSRVPYGFHGLFVDEKKLQTL